MSSVIARNVAANWLGLAITGIAGLVVTPIVIRYLGPVEYGTWSIIAAITSQLMIFDLGVRDALVKFIPEYGTDGHDAELGELSTSAFAILSLITAILCGLAVVVCPFFSDLIQVPEDLATATTIAFGVTLLDSCIALVSAVAEAGLAGRERYDLLSFGYTIRFVLTEAVTIPIVIYGGGMVGVAVASLATSAIYRVWLFIRLRREMPAFSLSPRRVSLHAIRKIIRYGIWAFVIIISMRMIFSLGVLILGYAAGPVAAGIYAVCTFLVDQIRQVAQSGTAVLTPRFSAMASNNTELKPVIITTIRITQALGVVAILPVVLTGYGFLNFYAGPGYAAGHPTLVLLSLPFLICLPSYLFTSLLYAQAKHQFTAKLLLTEAICNLCISVALVKSLGAVGVALGTFIPAIIFRGILLPRYGCRFAGITRNEYWNEVLWRPIPIAACMMIALVLGTLFFSVTTVTGWVMTNTLGVIIFAAATPALLMSRREQRLVLNKLKASISAFKR